MFNSKSDFGRAESGPRGMTSAFEDDELPDGWEDALPLDKVSEEIQLTDGGIWTTVNPLVALQA